jgi:hypothetical protein
MLIAITPTTYGLRRVVSTASLKEARHGNLHASGN